MPNQPYMQQNAPPSGAPLQPPLGMQQQFPQLQQQQQVPQLMLQQQQQALQSSFQSSQQAIMQLQQQLQMMQQQAHQGGKQVLEILFFSYYYRNFLLRKATSNFMHSIKYFKLPLLAIYS